ncbi:MAG: outer membrane protein assembly factor BamB [Verrucomicrobiales bacterium]|jgi:outer membrane protein assembly factor BamB
MNQSFFARALVTTGAILTTMACPLPVSAAAPQVVLKEIYQDQKLVKPVQQAIVPDGSNRRFLLQQTGEIYILPADETSAEREIFLDISDRSLAARDGEFEEGLLNISFHPQFKENRKFYIYYSQQNPKRSVVSEMLVSQDNPSKADLSSERILMEVPQPFWNHNSGNMAFGPEGYLYICLGDGGKGNDPHQLAQNLWVLNGKILRIDVDGRSGALAYRIPDDNPFVRKPGQPEQGIRPEIWCYGMRNPWGIYFEPGNDRFWVADVGQAIWEEVNIIEKGGNYGWNYREGDAAFSLRTDAPPEEVRLIDPIHAYDHTQGISITGGVVYRGEKMPELKGYYIYGDWGSGNIWALKYADGKVAENTLIVEGNPGVCKPTAFNEDENHEILVLSYNAKIFRMATAATAEAASSTPEVQLDPTKVTALVGLPGASADAWPQYNGANSNRTTAGTIGSAKWPASGPRQLWKTKVNTGFSSFVVTGDQVFTTVKREVEGIDYETIIALDADSGKQQWAYPMGLTRYDGGGDSGASGNKGGDGPRSTPAVSDGHVFAIDGALNIACVEAANGKAVWTHSIAKDFGGKNIKWMNAACPLIEGDAVYVIGGGKGESILCFDKKTGDVRWKKHDYTLTHATPIAATIHGKRQVIFFAREGLVSLDPQSGDELWFFEFLFRTSTAAAPVVWNDIVYCSAGYGVGAGACKIVKDGSGFKAEELWRKEGDLPNHWSTPVCKDGFLYGMFSFKEYGDGPLKCVDIRNGEVKWSEDGYGPGNVILVGNHVVALSDSGEIALVEATPESYNEISRSDVLDGKCWSTPVFANGRIYARSTEEGVCIDVN